MPYPHAGKFRVAIESRKQAASRPSPPLPRAASLSFSTKFSILQPISLNASVYYSQKKHDEIDLHGLSP